MPIISLDWCSSDASGYWRRYDAPNISKVDIFRSTDIMVSPPTPFA